MDTNLKSCSKCGHSVSETAEACTYCGAVVPSGESPPQLDEIAPGSEAQTIESPPLPADDFPPVLDMTDESASTPEASAGKSEAEPSSQSQPEEIQPEINEPAAEAVSGAEDQLSDVDDQIDFQLPDEELIVELDAEGTANDLAQASGADTSSAEIKEPELKPDTSVDQDDIVDLEQHAAEPVAEVIPLAGKAATTAASDDSPGLPETPVLEVSGEDPSESETLGADILELVEVDASEPESTREQISETAKSSDEPAVEKKAEPALDPTSDGSDNNDEEIEAILLTSDDEVQSGSQSLPPDVEEAVKTGESEKPVELLKKQKAALSKAQVLKMKKLKLAQVQALKRKKAAMIKAQALKKQKAAQAGIEKANRAMAAGSKPQKVDNPNMIIQSMEANTKMLGLLKKYEGQAIGINYDNSADIKEAELVEANDEFFSVFVKDQGLNYSHPLKTILSIIEGKDGVGTGKPEQKEKFNAVIKVYPLVLF
ncbi:MAG: hypothetical protein IMF02_14050 [Proteobacteria bacterium]|nr:hypothetical protein [Pseudomonadota bacterium]